ncbi:MAG TPA: SGNH/GDSL hydrolase family protein [Labilithrix sp.]|nr:SGNH/GDSL hydrolase family protein [Labilithrix sp.]
MDRARLIAFCALVGACSPSHRAPSPAAAPVLRAPAALPLPEPVRATEAQPEAAASEPASEPAPAAPSLPAIAIHKGTRVLMFGDSMVTSGLGVTLEERVVAQGGKFFHISKPSSTSLTWAEGRALQDLVLRTRPDVVIVVLASNELFVPNPHARAGDVRTIVQRIGARPCLWIGPAPWRPEKGIIGVVRESSTPCRFFDSSSLALERGPDGIHPTLHGGKTWANAVWKDTFATTAPVASP